MRLIDVDALKNNLASLEDLRTLSTKTIGEAIKKTPTVDAVEVVRCKDCKYRNKDKTCRNSMGRGILVMNDIEFCSCGERKVSE